VAFELLTDDDLTAMALAADPDAEPAEDAVCLWDLAPEEAENLLPAWWRRSVVLVLIASFILINAAGLCVTYGWVQFG
jgi:hypothetical protein